MVFKSITGLFLTIISLQCCVIFGQTTIDQNQNREDIEPLSHDMVDFINNEANTTWKAAGYDRFVKNGHDATRLMGDISHDGGNDGDNDKMSPYYIPYKDEIPEFLQKKNRVSLHKLPESFDAREHWPECPSIKEISDQSHCGACWAVASADTMTDRICINLKKHYRLSATHLLSCCNNCGLPQRDRCTGAYTKRAWYWYKVHGIVTGSRYNASKKSCKNYPFPPCNHLKSKAENKNLKSCSSLPKYAAPKCSRRCGKGYGKSFQKDLHFGKHVYRVRTHEQLIRQEIMENGPVTSVMYGFADFLNYKSGVYQHKAGRFIAKHAVRIIGWGKTKKGLSYWLVANSYNANWGEKGLFRILRGKNHCNIEDQVYTSLPMN